MFFLLALYRAVHVIINTMCWLFIEYAMFSIAAAPTRLRELAIGVERVPRALVWGATCRVAVGDRRHSYLIQVVYEEAMIYFVAISYLYRGL